MRLSTGLYESSVKAAIVAGERIMEIYDSEEFKVNPQRHTQYKSDNSPLTLADQESHRIIQEFLEPLAIPMLSEEGDEFEYSERREWNRLWIVDPLDGTKEFLKRNGEFTVNIALVERGNPLFGVIYVPFTKTLYFGGRDFNSYKTTDVDKIYPREDLESLVKRSIVLPEQSITDDYVVVASRSHMNDDTQQYVESLNEKYEKLRYVSSGSSIKLCFIAEGSADVYPRFAPTMEWDIAAGHAIIQGAGRRVIDHKTGKEMLYNRENLKNKWFIAS